MNALFQMEKSRIVIRIFYCQVVSIYLQLSLRKLISKGAFEKLSPVAT